MRNKNMSWDDSIETAGYKKWLDETWEFKTQFWKELHDAVEDEEIVLSIAKILNLLHEDSMYEEGMDLLYLISSLLGLYDEELVRVYEKVKHIIHICKILITQPAVQ